MRSSAVRWTEIHNALDLPCRVVLLVDTCHSSGVSGMTKIRALDNDRLVKGMEELGIVIFTSSRGIELSQEKEEWGHGAFTYALIQGLEGREADLIKDGRITMKELDTYVSQRVPQLTDVAQHPITHAPMGYEDFVIVE